ncbi:MAG: glycosyltransferase [Puia sp.]|nr:glycosyltransferase [Puia sp.]
MSPGILLLTTTNLACNPRCLKEVRLLHSMGVKVTVVAFDLHNWTTEKERELNGELKGVNFHYLESGRRPFIPWLRASVEERIGRLAGPLFPSNAFLSALAVSKRSGPLLRWVRKERNSYDLVIAHNPGAFYAAAHLSHRMGIPFALDIEDYHPGEGNGRAERQCVGYLMRMLMERSAYCSFASPLIMRYSQNLLHTAGKGDFFVVNNSFPLAEFQLPRKEGPAGKKLQLVWFSQFIDYGRGLEKIFPALDRFAGEIELTLFGTARDTFFRNEMRDREYIRYAGSLSQKELHLELGRYDAGLALEDGTVDQNRNLCLTNKIWSYLQAGLYIVATNTDAQQLFLQEHPGHGISTSLSVDVFAERISGLIRDKETIRAGKPDRYEAAARVSWDHDAKVLQERWSKILS